MNWSAEALLSALIVGLYLKDSLLLLQPDEAVLARGFGSRWSAGFGARGFRLAHREVYLAHPFTPHRAVFRLGWDMTRSDVPIGPCPGDAPQDDAALAVEGKATAALPSPAAPPMALLDAPRELMRLGFLVWITWLLLFACIPAALLMHAGDAVALGLIALLYLNIAASLGAVWRWKQPLGLDRKAFATLAFECLACAPYAANLVRRLAMQQRVDEDFVVAASRLLTPDRMRAVKRECLARIDEQIELEPPQSPKAARLREARPRFIVDDAEDEA